MNRPRRAPRLTRKDFVAPDRPRWCPGCGDYAILNALQNTLPELGIPKERFVMISGIGCSSRLPYYMDTYGFHTIHGRAPAVATGVKLANPDLSVWVITGDGDGLSIGTNHLVHLLRRNLDINVLLFNNRIYGLTKGQYSPTSERGLVTKSSPAGSIEAPLNPSGLALAAEAGFVARTVDTNPRHMAEVFAAAARHRGTSFIEIFQNCITFHNRTWETIAGREVRDDRMLFLEHGKPLVFGKERDKGIRLNGLRLEVVEIGGDVREEDLLVHDVAEPNPAYAYLLTQMSHPEFPSPVGVLRAVSRPTFEGELRRGITEGVRAKGRGDLQKLLLGDDHWRVTDGGRRVEMGRARIQRAGEEERIMEDRIRYVDRARSDPLAAALLTPIREIYESYAYKRVKRVSPDATVAEVIPLFKAFNVGFLLVEKDGRPEGLLSERDIVMHVVLREVDRERTRVSALLEPGLDALGGDQTVADAINLLAHRDDTNVVLRLAGGRYGVVTTKQILWFIHDAMNRGASGPDDREPPG